MCSAGEPTLTDAIAKLQFENMFAHYQLQIDFIQKLMEQIQFTEDSKQVLTEADFQKYFE